MAVTVMAPAIDRTTHTERELGVEAGSTWGDFVEAVRRFGVRDSTPMHSIVFRRFGKERLYIDRDAQGAISVWER